MSPLATVGILSIGEMGMGIAKLLIAHNYRVVTNLEGRRYVLLAPYLTFCSQSQVHFKVWSFLPVSNFLLKRSLNSSLTENFHNCVLAEMPDLWSSSNSPIYTELLLATILEHVPKIPQLNSCPLTSPWSKHQIISSPSFLPAMLSPQQPALAQHSMPSRVPSQHLFTSLI